jgi:hypothetical protein
MVHEAISNIEGGTELPKSTVNKVTSAKEKKEKT